MGCENGGHDEETWVRMNSLSIYGNLTSSVNFCHSFLISVLNRRCNLIALGNGTACRETELWITELFAEGVLDEASVRYSIVSEQGASIYSCGEVAKKEFPKMDVNLISAGKQSSFNPRKFFHLSNNDSL